MMAGNALPLRDIHIPAAPAWWPPAPGWWLLAAVLLVLAATAGLVLWRRARRRRRLREMFDREVAAADTVPERIAAISVLLRRAVCHREPAAAALQGEAWLAWLARDPAMEGLDAQSRAMLLEGGYRRDLEGFDPQALHDAARACFVRLGGGRR